MPKIYTYNAEFNPISFTDRIAPLKLYKEEYDKQQAVYEKLLEETDDLGSLKNVAMDSDSYAVYKSFQDELNSIAGEMSTNGLSQDVRNRLLNLKRRQSSEINPLLEKQKKRAELVAEQRKYRETHNSPMFDVDYNEVPLSQITSESTFTPYDLDKDYASVADAVYSNIMSNNGTDTTDYNKIKSQFNYNKLSPQKQKVIDDMIGLAKSKAMATYQIYKDKEAMDRYRWGKTKSGNTTQVQSSVSHADMLDPTRKGPDNAVVNGNVITITTGTNGIKELKNFNNKKVAVEVPQKKDGESKEAYEVRAQEAIIKAYYGHNYLKSVTLDNGNKVDILYDKNGDKMQCYIINNKNKIVPVQDIKYGTLLQEYEGKSIGYANGETRVSMKDDNRTVLTDYDKSKYEEDFNNQRVISSISQANENGINNTILNKLNINLDDGLAEFLNNGYEIVKIPIVSKKHPDKIVGYTYFTRKATSGMDE